jgi:hypothetical protein
MPELTQYDDNHTPAARSSREEAVVRGASHFAAATGREIPADQIVQLRNGLVDVPAEGLEAHLLAHAHTESFLTLAGLRATIASRSRLLMGSAADGIAHAQCFLEIYRHEPDGWFAAPYLHPGVREFLQPYWMPEVEISRAMHDDQDGFHRRAMEKAYDSKAKDWRRRVLEPGGIGWASEFVQRTKTEAKERQRRYAAIQDALAVVQSQERDRSEFWRYATRYRADTICEALNGWRIESGNSRAFPVLLPPTMVERLQRPTMPDHDPSGTYLDPFF